MRFEDRTAESETRLSPQESDSSSAGVLRVTIAANIANFIPNQHIDELILSPSLRPEMKHKNHIAPMTTEPFAFVSSSISSCTAILMV